MNRYESFPIHVVSAVRNEDKYLPKLADSILSQTERPYKWSIIDDGSTDKTHFVIEALQKDFDWIEGIALPDRGFTDRGRGNSAAIKLGFETALKNSGVQALGTLDADITFDEVAMEHVYDSFLTNKKLV